MNDKEYRERVEAELLRKKRADASRNAERAKAMLDEYKDMTAIR